MEHRRRTACSHVTDVNRDSLGGFANDFHRDIRATVFIRRPGMAGVITCATPFVLQTDPDHRAGPLRRYIVCRKGMKMSYNRGMCSEFPRKRCPLGFNRRAI